MKNTDFCNNCGKTGHNYNQCKMPITSFGLIIYRINKNNKPEVLMIRRKDSLGYVEFVRGKYSLMNPNYIINILNEMTISEREKLKTMTFDQLWNDLWNGNIGNQYRSEEKISREKYETLKIGINNDCNSLNSYNQTHTKLILKRNENENEDEDEDETPSIGVNDNDNDNDKNTYKNNYKNIDDNDNEYTYNLENLLEKVKTNWTETEWGFPKGRRNYQEKDIVCALREFEEETGYSKNKISIIQNILPYDEIFTGSNYKCYKHRYYVGFMNYSDTEKTVNFQKNEVSKCEWLPIDDCVRRIRPYNKERIEIIKSFENVLKEYIIHNDD